MFLGFQFREQSIQRPICLHNQNMAVGVYHTTLLMGSRNKEYYWRLLVIIRASALRISRLPKQCVCKKNNWVTRLLSSKYT